MRSLLRSVCCLQQVSAHFENLQFSNDQLIHSFRRYCHTLDHAILKAKLYKLALPFFGNAYCVCMNFFKFTAKRLEAIYPTYFLKPMEDFSCDASYVNRNQSLNSSAGLFR